MLGREGFFDHVRVAGELRAHAVLNDAHIVRAFRRAAGIVQLLVAVQAFGIGVGIEHGRIRPAAVVAEDRDRVFVIVRHAFVGGGHAAHVGEALDVAAVFSVFEDRLLRIGQFDVDRDLRLIVRRNGVTVRNALAGLPVQEQLRVDGGDQIVPVHIGNFQKEVFVLFAFAGQVIEDRLRVVVVGVAVAVDVVAFRDHGRAVPFIGDAAEREQSRRVHQISVGDRLREEIGLQLERKDLVGEVVEGEAVFVLALSCGIVAQLDLDLAVRIRACVAREARLIHHDNGLRRDRVADFDKTGALLQDRHERVVVDHRRRRRHQQTLCDRTEVVRIRQVRIRRRLLLEVLHQDRRKAGDMRRRHGRAGIADVLVRTGVAVAGSGGRTVQRVDVAARCGDLRLHDQRTRNAPGTEGGNFSVFAVLDHFDFLRGDLHRSGVIVDAGRGVRGACRLDRLSVSQKDHDHREGARKV